ncbi:MAG: methylated-DNA--[protein]-cysteine S-methyltransferase [Burkholderiaceae bacterium]|nr:MAG: methylated-DNA--[protein]-cysteine S-methyltransferase [Burkholderiaceae bacterium]
MKTRSASAFNYHFRTLGSPVQGPIRFAIGQTTRGEVLIGQGARGICAIFLGDDARALRSQLAAAFPGAQLRADPASLQSPLGQVIDFIDTGTPRGAIDLDIGGTAFEQEVWRALCAIPTGTTRSYGEVARDLGMPKAARAVARACAANVLAIAIPCHRVVRSDGSISGYRWGVERKRALLAGEAAHAVAGSAA